MAVQAQHPSNVLFLERSVQEGKNPPAIDYSMQPQPGGGGGFVDQSHHQMMILRNGVGRNPRKRGRESSVYNPFCIQQSQLIDVLTGLRLASGEQLQQQQQQQQNLSRQAFSSPQSSLLLSVLSEDFAAQIRQQRDEIQQFLLAQGEELRRTLAAKRQRHYLELLGAAEESAARRLREKDAELEKAARRNAELEALAAQLSAESQAWQTRARAQEAAAAVLQAQLQQAVMSAGGKAEELGGGEAEDAESAYIDPERVEAMESGPCCKGCRKRAATVVVLPCRHLCLCAECGVVAQACPLCLTVRRWMLEVAIS